ncbi:MAG: GNAT family N-acetyltransferase [Cyclobacteriaceae bacterium]
MNKLSFRSATRADVPLLKHWDEQPHVIASDPEQWDWESDFEWNDPAVRKFIAELDGRPIGFVQIIEPQLEQSHYWGEIGSGYMAIDIWIGEAYDLNKGYGTKMMKIAIDKCFSDPAVHTILIDPLKSNVDAHRFYKRIGFEFVEERDFNDEECFVFQLKRSNFLK